MHVLIPCAVPMAPDGLAALRTLELPRLERLLSRLRPAERDMADEFTLSPPHERVLARLLGLPLQDGRLPWAAQAPAARGDALPHAWITPCHWRVAPDHISLADPDALRLDQAESAAFLALAAPYFAEDGIGLDYVAPTCWRASGEMFRDLACASLDRVTGRSLDLWMPDAPAARGLRRLQGEMQMLFYTSPLNDARESRGLAPVNSFWISGAGAWPAGASTDVAGLVSPQSLRHAALRDDWTAWHGAWTRLDAEEIAEALHAFDRGADVALTLCGDRGAQTFRRGSGGSSSGGDGSSASSTMGCWRAAIAHLLGRRRFPGLVEHL